MRHFPEGKNVTNAKKGRVLIEMASYDQYEAAIARAKAALESYSSEAEELARLYETAKANAQTAYEAQKEQTAAQAAESRRKAGVEMQRTERNLDQRLAARGLAFSGENAQTRLDLLVALRNQLAGIDSDERNQLAGLDQALADRQNELDMAYAGNRADIAKQYAALNADLASAEAGKAAAQEAAEASKAAAAAAAAASKGGNSSGKTDSPNALEKAKEAVKAPLTFGSEFQKLTNELVERFLGKSAAGKQSYVPEVSARMLANQLVKAAGSNGRIAGSRQQASLASLLDALLESVNLDSAYYNELMLNLRSLGYRPDYAQKADQNASQLQSDSRGVYEQMYSRYFNLYRHAGEVEGDAAHRAEQEARYLQLRYLYTHSADEDEFDYVVGALGLNSYLNAFYTRLNKEDTKVKLGSEL